MLLLQGRGEISDLPRVTSVLFLHTALNTWTDSNVVSTGRRENCGLPAELQYCYITVLWIHGLIAMLLLQGREEMAVLPAVTAIPLHHIAMDTWTDFRVVCTD